MRLLYRGFGLGTVAETLIPKQSGNFEHLFHHDGLIKHDGSAAYGKSARNAVLLHELHQKGYPTAGISTSPHRHRALFYALGGGAHREGTIITIDRDKLVEFNVVEHPVAATVTNPSIPEDEEVILVSKFGGALPLAIVIAEERVYA